MKSRFLSVIVCVLSAFSAYAQGSISVRVEPVVALDEQFNLTFEVRGDKVSDFHWQSSGDFTVQWGPQTMSSSQTYINNGKRTHTVTTSYTYVLLPVKEGTFTIPACSAKIKGQTVTSQPVDIKVVKARTGTSAATSATRGSTTVGSEDLFLRMLVDKRDVVLGEPVSVTLKLFKKVQVEGFEDVKFPSFDGFWTQTLESPTNINFTREALGEEIYETAVLRSYRIIPQKAGELEIDPAEIVCRVAVRRANTSTGSIFDDFFQNDYNIIRKRVSTRPVTINVAELPQPQPASFCGGVGKFNVAISLSTNTLKTHDAASLMLTVKGEGNLDLIMSPKVKFPSDFEVYDVKTSSDGNTRIFEYPFIPRHYGDYTIGPVEFSYYDIDSKTYKTTSAQALALHVEKADIQDGTASQVNFIGAGPKVVSNLGTDIRYIHTAGQNFRKSGVMFSGSPLFWGLAAFIMCLAIIAWFVYSKVNARRSDVAGTRRRTASKWAKKRLARSRDYLSQNLSGAFYEELHKALLGFVADKLSMDMSGLDKENISASLISHGVDEAVCKEFTDLLDACEYARYAPSAGNGFMQAHYDKGLALISTIDSLMNKKSSKISSAAILALVLMLGGPVVSAQDSDSGAVWDSAVQAYAEGEYAAAFDLWSGIEAQGLQSADLYYNMACASFKDGNAARAVLYFERCLKVDPSHADAKANLEYSRQFLQDRIDEVPEFFLLTWVRNLENVFAADTWAAGALLLFAAFCILGVLFLASSRRKARIVYFATALLSLLLAAGCLGFSLSLKSRATDDSYAIVMSAVSVVRSSPDDFSGTELFVLHEGAKTRIIERVGVWSNIELSDGRQGWIKNSCLESI